jgi:plastocyanin
VGQFQWVAVVVVGLWWTAPAVAQTGSVDGVVRTKARALRPIRVTIDQKVCGAQIANESILAGAAGQLANAVVTLRGAKSREAPPTPLVTNAKCRFVPRVQIVRPNAAVRTTSEDPMLHTTNVQDARGRTVFNLAIPVPGIVLGRPVEGAGIYRVGCSIHQWMRGWLVVTDEVAAVTGSDGRFVLTGVPPGTYELGLWHEALKAAPTTITVAAGKPTQVEVEMK